jgi:hypothetical protein
MSPEERLSQLGLSTPPPPAAVGAYVPWTRAGTLVVTSFQLPFLDGELAYTGRLGAELTLDEG